MTRKKSGFVLASGSPRRRNMLQTIGLEHIVFTSNIDETPLPGEAGRDYALRAAEDKARAVAQEVGSCLVLGADTVVEIDGEILGKPRSKEEAEEMLRRLSGHEHRVHTSMVLVQGSTCEGLVDTTTVRFKKLEPDVIRWYVESGEPMDKAGAYAIQGIGGLLVEGIEGSPQTVVGLPIHRLPELFSRHGLDLWEYLRVR